MGVYWVPVFVSLETDFELLPVNAAHMRNVAGRKTDVADAGWIAQHMLNALIAGERDPARLAELARGRLRRRSRR